MCRFVENTLTRVCIADEAHEYVCSILLMVEDGVSLNNPQLLVKSHSMNLKIVPFLFILSSFLNPDRAYAKTLTIESPDHAIKLTVNDDNQQPQYSIDFNGKILFAPSKLGIKFANSSPLAEDFIIASHKINSVDQSWQQPWGEARDIRDHHNELLVEFVHKNTPDRKYKLRFRVFNDGVGFRYEVFNHDGAAEIAIIDELTEFSVAEINGNTAWWIPAKGWNRYEFLYQTTDFEQIDRVNTPFTFRTKNNVHVSIHEAALVDYASMTLDQQRPGVLKADLIPWSDGIKVKTKSSFKTPWRSIQIAKDAVGLLNSHLILNLNEPNKLGDVSWVKPGKYVGIWWGMHLGINSWGSGKIHGATTSETKRYIDFAAKHGFDGVLVEGWNIGWDGAWFSNGDVFDFSQSYPDFNLEEVTGYAKQRSVKLIGHHETSGSVTNYRNQMKQAYDLYQKNGVSQIKTGYVADGGHIKRFDDKGQAINEWHDGQFMVNEYLHSVTEAAKRQISINTHEPIKDTGLRRTYPNWISREGARGQEFNAWGKPHNPPEHTVILPYTRMLSGPMDFTPGIFNLAYKGLDAENRVPTTLAKQLALYVVLYSPIQMAADLPRHYEEKLAAFQFIKEVPTDWEKSIALAGEVGDYVVFARKQRNSPDWFLGAITDERARKIEIDLNFLTDNKKYRAHIYRDGKKADWKMNPYEIIIEDKLLSKGERLLLNLATSGGTAIRFEALGD